MIKDNCYYKHRIYGKHRIRLVEEYGNHRIRPDKEYGNQRIRLSLTGSGDSCLRCHCEFKFTRFVNPRLGAVQCGHLVTYFL